MMLRYFMLLLPLSLAAQVEINQPLILNGTDGQRRVGGLDLPANATDAASKEYVDAQVGNAGGGLAIGELYGGGVICALYKDANGTSRGLVISPIDNAHTIPYSNVLSAIGATGQSNWNGLANSQAIIGQGGHTESGALICQQYSGGGFTDWFLPASTQLSAAWNSMFAVNKTLNDTPGAQLMGQYYWTSTEVSAQYALAMNFQSGAPYQEYKGSYVSVLRARCMREF